MGEDMGAMEAMVTMERGLQLLNQKPWLRLQLMPVMVMEDMEAMVDMEATEDMEDMATEATVLAAMEVMGMARGQPILAMVLAGAVPMEAMGVTRVMVVIEAMATMAKANQIQMMMTRILRENQ